MRHFKFFLNSYISCTVINISVSISSKYVIEFFDWFQLSNDACALLLHHHKHHSENCRHHSIYTLNRLHSSLCITYPSTHTPSQFSEKSGIQYPYSRRKPSETPKHQSTNVHTVYKGKSSKRETNQQTNATITSI